METVDESQVDDSFEVVVNHEEQYSVWPSDREPPAGWHLEGTRGSRDQCLAHIDTVWLDITPKSVRERLAAERD
ncbi:MAG: MbtH protein [Mycobacteriales bacterium]